MSNKVNLFWFRRDLRLHDNVGLYRALQGEHPVLPIFIFDTEILDKFPKDDARVSFIHGQLQNMRRQLQQEASSNLAIYHGNPQEIFQKIIEKFDIGKVFTNHDYEPYARKRDNEIKDLLESQGIAFKSFKDQVIFEKSDVVKDDGNPYVVYTPYKRRWKEKFNLATNLLDYKIEFKNFVTNKALSGLTCKNLRFNLVAIVARTQAIQTALVASEF